MTFHNKMEFEKSTSVSGISEEGTVDAHFSEKKGIRI